MKKKKSKQENLLSPSHSWRENHNPPRRNSSSSAVSSGCLPGFFNLFLCTFNFSSNRRKSITLGSKKQQEPRTVVYASPPQPQDTSNGGGVTVEPPLPSNEDAAARVSLVGALEKCDRDLEELRRTIEVIRTSYLVNKKLEVSPATARGGLKCSGTVAGDTVVGTQANKNTKTTTIHETDTDTTTLSTMMNHHEYKDNKVNHINLITRPNHHDVIISKRPTIETREVTRSLMEDVNEVCEDVASGQRRGVAKIGLALHDHICRDLISETVHELSSFCSVDSADCYGRGSGRGSTNSLPLDACRRRLVF